MNIPEHRKWMVNRLMPNRVGYTQEFINGVEEFDAFARAQPVYSEYKIYWCPCASCKNTKFWDSEKVKLHLFRKGFVSGYWYWTSHGEVEPQQYGTNFHQGSLSMKVEVSDGKSDTTKKRRRYGFGSEGAKYKDVCSSESVNNQTTQNTPNWISHEDFEAMKRRLDNSTRETEEWTLKLDYLVKSVENINKTVEKRNKQIKKLKNLMKKSKSSSKSKVSSHSSIAGKNKAHVDNE